MARLRPDLSPEEWERLDGLLDRVLDADGAERDAVLASLSESDRQTLESLLDGDDGSALETVASLSAAPERIGPWELGPMLGEGGMSAVYAASRADGELTIEAAVKMMRRGPGTLDFEDRFRRERQILVELRHPHIVRVLDGGTTDGGTPYYVMERISGSDWSAWCGSVSLDVRLDALIQVCEAVEHAHQKLVVHCDLKPENVVVDPDGGPRVLDFGIAKLMADDGRTATGQRMLTPRWAAPEQIDGSSITTRTDVHGLGLLLWTAVTGELPWASVSGTALLMAVSETTLPSPSSLEPLAAGDLDAIVAKATAKDPDERYRSAGDLARDLRRMRNGEAVEARSASSVYRLWRWVRNHPLPVVATMGIAVLLVGWGASVAFQNARIAEERDAAEAAAQRARASFDLLVQLLEGSDPAVAQGRELSAREVLDQASRTLDAESDPALRAELRAVIGRVQAATWSQEATDTLTKAVAELTALHGPNAEPTLRAELTLVATGFGSSRAVEPALEILGRLEEFPELQARGLLVVAEQYADLEQYETGSRYARQAEARFETLGDVRRVARARAVDAFSMFRLGRRTEAHARMLSALERLEIELGTRMHPEIAEVLHELVMVAPDQATGLKYGEESIAIKRALYGERFTTAVALNNLGLAYEYVDTDRSIALLREAVAMAGADIGVDAPQTQDLKKNLGAVLSDKGIAEGRAILIEVESNPATSPSVRERARHYIDLYDAASAD